MLGQNRYFIGCTQGEEITEMLVEDRLHDID